MPDATAPSTPPPAASPQVCQCIDWYAEGEARTVEVDGVEVTIRFVGRKGRRGRICITAPAGAVFRSTEGMPRGIALP